MWNFREPMSLLRNDNEISFWEMKLRRNEILLCNMK